MAFIERLCRNVLLHMESFVRIRDKIKEKAICMHASVYRAKHVLLFPRQGNHELLRRRNQGIRPWVSRVCLLKDHLQNYTVREVASHTFTILRKTHRKIQNSTAQYPNRPPTP